MPIPKPRTEEERDEFIARFMRDDEMREEYPDEDQRLAIAFDTWRNQNKSVKKYETIDFKPRRLSRLEKKNLSHKEA